jgi:hypothetical protein
LSKEFFYILASREAGITRSVPLTRQETSLSLVNTYVADILVWAPLDRSEQYWRTAAFFGGGVRILSSANFLEKVPASNAGAG